MGTRGVGVVPDRLVMPKQPYLQMQRKAGAPLRWREATAALLETLAVKRDYLRCHIPKSDLLSWLHVLMVMP